MHVHFVFVRLELLSILYTAIDRRVRLLMGTECVGIAQLMEGDQLHCHKIPRNYTKVMLEAIKPNLPPPIKGPFNSTYLNLGQITAWSLNQIECI